MRQKIQSVKEGTKTSYAPNNNEATCNQNVNMKRKRTETYIMKVYSFLSLFGSRSVWVCGGICYSDMTY